ncbi:unnamed protein product [Cuscuta epithymum]|uniref:Core-2/I-branching beta-1,6-N-acetylglucosaminyltransferase family protein n=1 Tax=Cuscuta epithymum TaxID=186058 RepID=A0AAV0CPJ1_9ASTE|nr:unnamed protein product [Cuscuta epithymum]
MAKKASAVSSSPSPPPLSVRHMLWLGWKMVIALSLALCVLIFLRLHYYSLSDSDDLITASKALLSVSYKPHRHLAENFSGNPKVSFLFLTRSSLPLDFVWRSFFQIADPANFSIYIHSKPGFSFDHSTTSSPFFYNRQLNNSILVAWGESSMIEAERLLLAAALEDPANQRFVLLSDSCVPLYNFSYVYNYLMSSPKSFVDSFLDVSGKDNRYNPKMKPYIPKSKWRKGSQWIALVREHAEIVADDKIVLPVFRKYCKRRPPIEASLKSRNLNLQKQHNCIPDEHYVQTLLEMHGVGAELERRTITYTVWNQSTSNMEKGAWHPKRFTYSDAEPEKINKIKDIRYVYYKTEARTEWCSNNSTRVPCFLFARKFSRAAGMRLLSVVGGSLEGSAASKEPPP